MRNISVHLASTVLMLSIPSLAVSFLGCGGQDGPVRYKLDGSITMPDGKPAPAGEISFEPDSAAGNSGPGSMGQIKEGKYSLPKDQGVVGGKYVVTITPFDGVAFGESLQGKPLVKAPYVEKIEPPAKNGTQDFKVTTK